jgi:hypothetical protein
MQSNGGHFNHPSTRKLGYATKDGDKYGIPPIETSAKVVVYEYPFLLAIYYIYIGHTFEPLIVPCLNGNWTNVTFFFLFQCIEFPGRSQGSKRKPKPRTLKRRCRKGRGQ